MPQVLRKHKKGRNLNELYGKDQGDVKCQQIMQGKMSMLQIGMAWHKENSYGPIDSFQALVYVSLCIESG